MLLALEMLLSTTRCVTIACLEIAVEERKENMLVNKNLFAALFGCIFQLDHHSLFCGILYNIPEVAQEILKSKIFMTTLRE